MDLTSCQGMLAALRSASISSLVRARGYLENEQTYQR